MTDALTLPSSSWRLKPLFLSHLAIGLLLLSLFSPWTAPLWEKIDLFFFRFLNGWLEGSPASQAFWAMANHRYADWIEDLCILSFYLLAVRQALPRERALRVGQLLFCALIIALTIIVINRLLCHDLLKLRRFSPTILVEGCTRLSEIFPALHVKDDSTKSFPADHATLALLFAVSYTYFTSWRLGLPVLIYSAFLCLPRLVAGAHWISDTLVGSGSIVIFIMSWVAFTPLGKKFPTFLVKILRLDRVFPLK